MKVGLVYININQKLNAELLQKICPCGATHQELY